MESKALLISAVFFILAALSCIFLSVQALMFRGKGMTDRGLLIGILVNALCITFTMAGAFSFCMGLRGDNSSKWPAGQVLQSHGVAVTHMDHFGKVQIVNKGQNPIMVHVKLVVTTRTWGDYQMFILHPGEKRFAWNVSFPVVVQLFSISEPLDILSSEPEISPETAQSEE